jgi:hypothetical protein
MEEFELRLIANETLEVEHILAAMPLRRGAGPPGAEQECTERLR